MEDRKQVCSALRVGGQAVMEGVMMKGKDKYAVSVRKADGKIVTALFDSQSVTDRHKVLAWPVIRGIVRFVESLVVGMRTLTFSSGFFLEEEETSSPTKPAKDTAFRRFWEEHEDGFMTGASVVIGVILALGLFILLPALLTGWLGPIVHNQLLVSLIEGLLRVAIFIGYIVAISQMKDIQRVFEYHGAEHKTINCMEAGENLVPERIVTYTRLNRRCGTSFLFLVMLISILFFAVIYVSNPLLRLGLRILLIPVVAGVSYEVLMFSNRSEAKWVRILTWPGLMLQKLTTREPDVQEVETAIASTLVVLKAEGRLPEHLEEDWQRIRQEIELTDPEGNTIEIGEEHA